MIYNNIYLFFTGKNPLSNFYMADIKFKHVTFKLENKKKEKHIFKEIFPDFVDAEDYITFHSVEQFFMFCKALVFNDIRRATLILKAETPYECKKHGKLVLKFEEGLWDLNKKRIMYKACLLKFQSHEKLKEFLLDTQSLILAEASPYDKTWGIGLNSENPNAYDMEKWVGRNLLGKILMKVRKKIKHKEH